MVPTWRPMSMVDVTVKRSASRPAAPRLPTCPSVSFAPYRTTSSCKRAEAGVGMHGMIKF